MIRSLLTVLLLGVTLSCSDGVGPFSRDVEIRIANESNVAFTNVAVKFPQEDVDYGAVAAGGRSQYHRVGVAYRFARVDVRIGTTELRIQPIDYVGEDILEPGRYTYRLYFIDEYLQLEMKRDD